MRIFKRSSLCVAVLSALLTLSACGGGGGGGGGGSHDTWQPPLIPPVDQEPSEGIQGQQPSEKPKPETPAPDKTAGSRSFEPGWSQGHEGRGVRVGLVDAGINPDHAALSDRIDSYVVFNNSGPVAGSSGQQDSAQHGARVGQVIAGNGYAGSQAGYAPAARLEARQIGQLETVSVTAGILAMRDLQAKGVQIVNNSWNVAPIADPTPELVRSRQAFNLKAYADLVDGGMLIVQAVGNHSQSQPGALTLLPLAEASLQQGLIAVTGVQEEADGRRSLPSMANACGAASQWCLAAPSVFRVAIADGEDYSLLNDRGTSFAAPAVTAVAAALKQKYPWMSNDNLRTTLLTTAMDIGEPGVDEIFGWGQLDAAKAMNGPAQLAFGDMRADVTPGHYVFGNAISGQGGLIKQGPGVLELSADNSYSGGTRVEQGELRVSGALRSVVQVEAAGILSGEGRVGAVRNEGTVLSHGAGLTVQGDYRQGAEAVLDAQWGSVLRVQGQAELDGVLRLSGTRTGFVGQAGQWVTVLRAEQSKGEFSQVQDHGSVLLSKDVVYRADGVDLHYQPRQASSLVAARSGSPAADIVLRSARTLDAAVAGLSAAQDEQGDTAALRAAREATGRLQQMANSDQALDDVLYSLSGATYANALGVAARQFRAEGGLFMEQLSAAASAAASAGAGTPSTRAWASQSRHDTRWRPEELDGRLRADASLMGLTRSLGQGWSLGGAVGRQSLRWTEALTEQSQEQSSRIRSQSAMLGLAWQDEAGWRLQGAVAYQHFRQQAQRWLGSTQDGEAARGDSRGRAWSLTASAARTWPLGAQWSVTPSLGLAWQHLRQNAVQEQGGAYSLALDAVSRSLWTAQAAVRAAYDSQWAGRPLRLSAAVGYERDLGGNAFAYQAAYQGVPGSRFDQQGVALGRDRLSTQLRVDWQIGARTDLGLGVQTRHGKDWNSVDVGLQLGVRF